MHSKPSTIAIKSTFRIITMLVAALPNELLRAVSSYLIQSDLHSLSLCSRQLHSIAEPFLYAEFFQEEDHEIPLFLRTAASRPHLLKHMKHMSVWYATPTLPLPSLLLSDLTIQERTSLRKYMPDDIFGTGYCDSWAQNLFEVESWDAAVALLLVLFSPSLQTVDLLGPYEDFPGLPFEHITAVLDQASNKLSLLPQPFLSNLHEVFLAYQGLDARQIHQWARIPSVKRLGACAVFDEGSSVAELSNFHTKSISLHSRSSLDSTAMYHFLNSFRSLQHFSYGHGGDSILDPSAIRKGLQKSKYSLESLKLTIEAQEYLGTIDRMDPIGSLAGFDALKVLDVDIDMLVGWNGSPRGWYHPDRIEAFMSALPANLEGLVLRKCRYMVLDCMEDLFREGDIPNKLKTVRLVCANKQEFRRVTGESPLRWECEAIRRGVEVTQECAGDEN